ncbi:hypothetical protein [Nocardioides gilvus]|uniref:hypothetical protein n=1 Tax=Nocardioides gilvus TaxID=1735589 RepID=UPI000D74628E|nr:hypothetical protein [Nocardioides gilvus]
MSRPFRLPAVLSAAVTAALAGALLSAPTTASATTFAAPKASHVKACKKADFAGASRMRLQSSKKAVGKSGRTKATARAWVYTNQRQQACVVTSATSPKVKKTRKTTDISYSGYSLVESDSVIKFAQGHQLSMDDFWGDSNSFARWGRKAPRTTSASVIDLVDDGVMTAADLDGLPQELQTLKGQKYRMETTSLVVRWQMYGDRTVKTKKVTKAKAAKVRKAKFKKIAARRTAGLKEARTSWQEWVAAQRQTTAEERAWVKFYGDLIHDMDRMIVKGQAQSDKAMARHAAKEAVRGAKLVSGYRIKIDLPLSLPRS